MSNLEFKRFEDELDFLIECKELCQTEEEDDSVDERITQLILMIASQ